MIDIVTIVFRDELNILKVQAESIELYCQDETLGDIIVVINDDTMTIEDIDPTWYGRMAGRVKVIHRQEFDCKFADNGWLTQQLCKLLASATNTQSKWSMVLDAKTILVQPVDRARLFDDQHKLTWGYCPIFPVFAPAQQIVSKLFDIKLINVAGPAGVPFFFENKSVREMITEVEKRTQQPFAKWFQDTGMVTEFILYSGYIQYRDGSLDLMFTNVTQGYSLCNVCHSEVDNFDRKYLEMQEDNNLTVSIHRGAWSQLTDTQKKAYQDLLTTKGLTRATELI